MSVRKWWEGSPRDLATAVTTALVAGLAAASWLRLPTDLYDQPGMSASMILADDPGRAEWRAVISELGGLGATFVIPAAFYGPPPSAYPVYETEVDRDIDRLSAEIDAQMREADVRYVRWSRDEDWYRRQEAQAVAAQQDREDRQAEQYGYEVVPTVRRYASYRTDAPPPDEF